MQLHTPTPIFHSIRRDELRQERVHDPYKMAAKPAEPSVCSECHAVFHRGRWQWSKAPLGASPILCSACRRSRDRLPAGYVTLGGDYFDKHHDEVMGLVQNCETRERARHPMARIMGIERTAAGAVVTTTDIHMARSIGGALLHACQGELNYRYHRSENLLRVTWRR